MMKIYSFFIFIGILLFAQISCNKDNDAGVVPKGVWQQKFMDPQFPICFKEGVSFTVKDTLYVGFGMANWDKTTSPYFLRYTLNGEEEEWRLVAVFPGKPRKGAVAFVLGSKAYVGLGYAENEKKEEVYYDDFWVFDIKTERWEPEPLVFKFPGIARRGAVAFTLDGKGYVGTGDNGKNIFFDVYTFESGVGWKPFESLKTPMTGAVAFVADGNAYICTGGRAGEWAPWLFRGIYKFSSGAKKWSFMSPLEGEAAEVSRKYASAFVLNVKGKDYAYLVSGVDVFGKELFSCWGYDPRKDTWQKITDLPESIANGIGVSLGGRGYILGEVIYIFNPQ
ncbi:Kelch repeat-containing protein [Gabonibacter massiliensis]|uniref:Kelch repeat-containing protein n=1 Tax=Gabonibacter massiliensis TaxID=1720195 RepID=UPI0011CBB72E|nr:hypothetical protein [Gabonibacter massiliensis]